MHKGIIDNCGIIISRRPARRSFSGGGVFSIKGLQELSGHSIKRLTLKNMIPIKGTFLILVSILAHSCNHENSVKFSASANNDYKYDIESIQEDSLSTLDKLLNQAAKEKKNLFLVFGFEKCGWCKVFKMYHQDPAVIEILSKYFIVSDIDYDKTPDGMELYRTYGSTGFPSWAILYYTGKVLSDSEAPVPGAKDRTYNVGYPVNRDEMSWYISSLESAAPLISSESEILRGKLSYYHRNH